MRTPPKYPFRTMKVGESFVVAEPPSKFTTYCWRRGLELRRVFRTKQTPEGRMVTRVA